MIARASMGSVRTLSVHIISGYGLIRYVPGGYVMDLSQGAGVVLGLNLKMQKSPL